jgi:hypothetical protein
MVGESAGYLSKKAKEENVVRRHVLEYLLSVWAQNTGAVRRL